jgi:hypothetical protein
MPVCGDEQMKLTRMALAFAVAVGTFDGCTPVAPIQPATQPDYKNRAVTRSDGGLRVSTAVLSADESAAVYGTPLANRGIQPVWIEVENRERQAFFLLSPGLDPNFFPASEAAEAVSPGGSSRERAELDRRFRLLAFHNPVQPGTTSSGFVLTNLDEGVKFVQLDLVADGTVRTFSILVGVPGFRGDYKVSDVFRHEIYPPGKTTNYTDDDAFRTALESLPCCVTNKNGTKNGDPINLVLVGSLDDAFPALVRRGWHPTEEKWLGSVSRMVTSAVSGDRYTDAPVSDLYLFGRAQDLALQKARDHVHQRNHLRLWLSPIQYHGKQVWVGQISRDIGIRFTIHSPTLVTHKIDPNVDEAREALGQDIAYSQNITRFGFAKGVGGASPSAPRENLTNDPYYTDGYRIVLVFDRKPTPMNEIEFFNWGTSEISPKVVSGISR